MSTAIKTPEVYEMWELADEESDSPDRILTEDSIMPTEEERTDYADSFKNALDYSDTASNTSELLPKI